MRNDKAPTLTEFVEARIAEREAMAREALALASIYDQSTVKWHWTVAHSRGSTWCPTPMDPARVLAECASMRRIAFISQGWITAGHPTTDMLCFLALPDADHPDYLPEWKL